MGRRVSGMRARPYRLHCSCCMGCHGEWRLGKHASAVQLYTEQQLSRAFAGLQVPQALHAEGGAQQGPSTAQVAALPAGQLTQPPPRMLSAPHSAQEVLPAAQEAAAPAQAVPLQARLPAAEPPALNVIDITEDGSSHLVRPHPVILQSLPDVEQVRSAARLWHARLQYQSAVEALLKKAEELQQLPGVQRFLHRMQDDVQVGARAFRLQLLVCWHCCRACAKASSMHMHGCNRA